MARQLIIVSRDDVGLYHALCADWAGDPDVAVVLDRRRGQRRHETVPAAVERRRVERRQHPPIETYLAWRGGGAPARRSDVRSALNGGSLGVVVRQRPCAKAERRTPLRPPDVDVRDGSVDSLMTGAPSAALAALVIGLGTLSGGIVSGLALWLLMTCEFGSRGRWEGSAVNTRPDLFRWWRRPAQKLFRSSRTSAPAEKARRA